MKIVIVRHAEPDYANNTLTRKGFKEAHMLNEYLLNEKIDYAYASPINRAKLTAQIGLKSTGVDAIELPWLQEIQGKTLEDGSWLYAWDKLPEEWTESKNLFDHYAWKETTNKYFVEQYDWVCNQLDELLKKHGYNRYHDYYKAVKANDDCVFLFCHFGVACVMLSHLMNVSPLVLWHSLALSPSSMTTLITEERREGNAYFKILSLSEVNHLYKNNEPRSFMGRFCERYIDDTRHD